MESLPLDPVRNRLRLRIACRTLDWSHSFEKSLVGLWGSDEFRAFELAPLRELDVAVAAGIEGFDPPEDFLNEVKRAEVSALASRPITLKLLMQLYGESGSLPSERTKLYETGCLHLVRESNEHRTRGGRRGSLTVKQRFAVASRIAAATILTGRQEIADGVGLEPSDGKILVSELAGRSEIASEDAFNVDESAVIESLSTSLFTGWGVGSVGWAHRSLGEFLAATYLNRAEVALPQILSLLTHPRDPKGRIGPQLREVAAWLAS